MAKPKQTINDFYGANLMKPNLEAQIKDFSNLTGLPGETYPILFTNNILKHLTKEFNEGTTEQRIGAKRNLGNIWMNNAKYFMEPTGDEDFVDTKDAINKQYQVILPLIHKEHGAKIVDKSVEPLQEIIGKYKDLEKIKDKNERIAKRSQLDFTSGALIYQLYGDVLDNKQVKKLNALHEARKNKDMEVLGEVVAETTKEIGGVYHDLILNQVLSSERRMNTFIQRYEQLTINEIAKEYTIETGLNTDKLKKDLYSSLEKDMNKYPTLVNQIAAIAQQKAAEKKKAEVKNVEYKKAT